MGRMMGRAARRANLRRLLSPRHVAFVGGQRLAPTIGYCVDAGFAGCIWPVNPTYAEIAGHRCYKSIADLPEAPDGTFIAVPRELTIDIVRDLAARGAGGAVCYAAGFAETGGEGIELQKELVAASGDLALVGPNCYGILNYVDGVAMFASGFGGGRLKRGIAIIAQSGNLALNLTQNDRSVPIAYVITAGNQAVLKLADYIDVLGEDEHVSAMALYVEGLDDVSAFSSAVLKARRNGKQVIAFKAGNSELGARLAMSHTSSLAGSDKLYDALFARLGVIRVDAIDALLETAKLASVAGVPKGDRLAVFTCSGADNLMTADLAQRRGLKLPELSREQTASLRAQLPGFASVSNPLDYNTSLWGDGPALTRCFSTVMQGDFDAGMLIIDYPPNDVAGQRDCNIAVDALIEACRAAGDKTAIAASDLSELIPAAARRRMMEKGCAPLQGLEAAVTAFAALSHRGAQSAAADLALPDLSPAPADPSLREEWDCKQRLAKHGLKFPPGRLVTPEEVGWAAEEIGFPVVLKLGRPALAHKTEAGAVALNLADRAAVERAAAAMAASLARYKTGLVAERFLVERQVTGAVAELIIGLHRDPQFGLVLVVGMGGVFVELMEDAATFLLPTDRASVADAIGKLKVTRLLNGYRGKPAGDTEAVVDAVMAIASFADAHRERIVGLDVNPLMVLPRGKGAMAVDALIVMSGD
jgi:acyl-CoA synthetase (NDP forming)